MNKLSSLLLLLLPPPGEKQTVTGHAVLALVHHHDGLSLQALHGFLPVPIPTLRSTLYSLQNKGLIAVTTKRRAVGKTVTAYLSATCTPSGSKIVRGLLSVIAN